LFVATGAPSEHHASGQSATLGRVVDDLDVVGVVLTPAKTDAPLVADPDAMLACSIPFQLLKPIPHRDSQICQGFRGVEYQKSLLSQSLELGPKLADGFSGEDPGGLLVRKALDHDV
jgi:hypothetical protein